MRVIGRSRIERFIDRHATYRKGVATWLAILSCARWRSSHDLISDVPNTRGLGKGRFVFNICGNHVRAIVAVNFSVQVADVRFIGTHAEYDRIDARII
ncbi:MAG: type II toxin-antitoxin system HigB family toxin [Proteobacteria bacterium]|nr:type II toxin-antitoxin system HigB family toxin [Pseudomonadota bacterium]